jgi:hypothetical protein
MLAVALTWPISSNIGNYLVLKDFPREVLMTLVNCTERLDFHRLVRPGITTSLELKSRNKEDLFFEVMNQEGERPLARVMHELAIDFLRKKQCIAFRKPPLPNWLTLPGSRQ